ncbi:alpha-galactosidase [Prolixibacteraceae bacterium Z1-6]|uniref:Alpha-galactosidase n=1 Tax=Draconibacterium aestuarii TaxID=2998507 RepID=A0A9X3F4F5_9BACT|nr:alpha-galactosidase [Prolixibacteraceae bacterium Z1-6]
MNGKSLITNNRSDFSVTLWKAAPNKEPQGVVNLSETRIEQQNTEQNLTDALQIKKKENHFNSTVEWTDSITISGVHLSDVFDCVDYSLNSNNPGQNQLKISYSASQETQWQGLSVQIIYEIYDGFPVIRKWIKFRNNGTQWLKLGNLIIDDIEVDESYGNKTLLTPDSRGVASSIIAWSNPSASTGFIAASEVPSKLRSVSEKGALGYNPDFFEWVLGPSESFKSEAAFTYAFSDESYATISSAYTTLDRCVESDFKSFLKEKIFYNVEEKQNVAPVFCSWTNYNANINANNMRTAADIASRIGFKCFQLDAGWSDTGPGGGWAVSTINPNSCNFPDMKGTSNFIQSKGMKTGLWYSVFINENEKETNTDKPDLNSLPLIKRAGGLGLSFCYDESRKKYVNEIVYLNKNYQADYFKQDLSNICYGDIAQGHESRTLKESYLRGLRGLFETQDKIHRINPNVWLQLSHEIYWETPGPAADIAVLKHVDSYHAAPNEYWGAGNRKQQVNSSWDYDVDSLQQKLIQGAFRARNLMYAHRGLPLERIEIFGAVTTNFNGSLTPEIQDRQICSWLMGAPLSFSGDLSSLTEANISHYRNRFDILGRLENDYGIYSCFQFSGVPQPTDEDWHWWGKLNKNGNGIVVVMRGEGGDAARNINIPWVNPGQKYHLKTLFEGKDLGVYSGAKLQKGNIKLKLDPYSQEIIEIRASN